MIPIAAGAAGAALIAIALFVKRRRQAGARSCGSDPSTGYQGTLQQGEAKLQRSDPYPEFDRNAKNSNAEAEVDQKGII